MAVILYSVNPARAAQSTRTRMYIQYIYSIQLISPISKKKNSPINRLKDSIFFFLISLFRFAAISRVGS